jgi:hypothetical protein
MHPDPLIHPFGFWRADLNFFCLCIRRAIIKIVTGLSNGQICVLYSPTSSLNGAKLPLSKGPPRKVTIEDMSDALAQPAIITPHALPMFREGEIVRGTGKRKREKERLDPRKSRRPELPVTGPGKGGRVGASATQHVVQNLVKDTTREEDVRGHFFLRPPLSSDQLIIISSPLAGTATLLVRAAASSIGPQSRSGRALFLSCLLLPLFVIRDSHERRCCDTQKTQRRTRCGRPVSGVRGPWWLLFVVVCLAVATLTRSFLPPSAARRPSPSPPPLLCSARSLDEEPAKACVCRAGGGRGGEVREGAICLVARSGDCGRQFPGSVSASVYKGLGQNFPLPQSSLEIPWSPLSATPSPSHSFCHTPLPPHPPPLTPVPLPYAAK